MESSSTASSAPTSQRSSSKVRKTPEQSSCHSSSQPPSSRRRWQGGEEINPHHYFLPISYTFKQRQSSQTAKHDTVDNILELALHAVDFVPDAKRSSKRQLPKFHPDPFTQLPDDVMGKCLCSGYLDSLEVYHALRLVSKRFRGIVRQYARNLDLKKCRMGTKVEVKSMVLSTAAPVPIVLEPKLPFSLLSSLNLSYCELNTPGEVFSSMAHLAPTLKRLILKGTRIVDDDMKAYFSGPPCALEELDLSVIRKEDSTNLTDAIMGPMAVHLPNLTKLSLAWCRGITDVGMRDLCQNHSKLRALDVSLTGISSESCRYFSGMRILDVSATRVDNDGLRHLVSSSRNLSGIRLRFLDEITVQGVASLVKSSPSLTQLQTEHCENVGTYPSSKMKYDGGLAEIDEILRERRCSLR